MFFVNIAFVVQRAGAPRGTYCSGTVWCVPHSVVESLQHSRKHSVFEMEGLNMRPSARLSRNTKRSSSSLVVPRPASRKQKGSTSAASLPTPSSWTLLRTITLHVEECCNKDIVHTFVQGSCKYEIASKAYMIPCAILDSYFLTEIPSNRTLMIASLDIIH